MRLEALDELPALGLAGRAHAVRNSAVRLIALDIVLAIGPKASVPSRSGLFLRAVCCSALAELLTETSWWTVLQRPTASRQRAGIAGRVARCRAARAAVTARASGARAPARPSRAGIAAVSALPSAPSGTAGSRGAAARATVAIAFTVAAEVEGAALDCEHRGEQRQHANRLHHRSQFKATPPPARIKNKRLTPSVLRRSLRPESSRSRGPRRPRC